jgi:hypothetical protein
MFQAAPRQRRSKLCHQPLQKVLRFLTSDDFAEGKWHPVQAISQSGILA